jgi:hypothetical protein
MISICLLTKNENKYLKEWVQHHIDIGVDHFYIYDNNDDNSAQYEVLKYFDKQYFTFIHWHSFIKHMQIEAYNDCLNRFGNQNEWIAFIDTDEFINCNNIRESLEQYRQYDYIRIPWVMYNANGHVYYTNEPIRKRFTQTCQNYSSTGPTDYYKSIVQPSKIIEMVVHDAISFNNNTVVVDNIKLDHYYTRSLEEWVEKITRGTCSPYASRRYEEFFVYNPDLIEYKNKYLDLNAAQKYYDCLKTIDIKIMAHPSRRDNVLKICKQLNMDESIVVYDDRENGGDALYTARKAWLAPIKEGITHRLVLQDDVLLCDNFTNIVSDIINTLKEKVITLFNLIPVDLTKNKKCCYRKYEVLSGAAIIMPVLYIQDCWNWIDKHCDDCKHDDLMIAKYCKSHYIDMFTTIPCVVQHLGDTEYSSLLDVEYPGVRISTTYVQHPTDDFTIFIPENSKMKKFKEIVRDKRASRILEKRK